MITLVSLKNIYFDKNSQWGQCCSVTKISQNIFVFC